MSRIVAAVFLLAGILVAMFLAPEHGVNGWTLLAVALAFAGVIIATRAQDRSRG